MADYLDKLGLLGKGKPFTARTFPTSKTGQEVIGETEIKDKHGNLLVRFSSEDTEGFWGQLYEAERIKFAMRNRGKTIPEYLRTGGRPLYLKRTAVFLAVRNLLRR